VADDDVSFLHVNNERTAC